MALRVPATLRAFLAAAPALLLGCGPHVEVSAPTPGTWSGAAASAASSTGSVRAGGPFWNRPSPEPDRIILTWSDDPATTQSITWRTDTTVKSSWGEVAPAVASPRFADSARLVRATTQTLDVRHVERAGVRVNYHSLTFTGLEPATIYAYRVGDGEHWSEWFQFRTASRAPEPFSFLYFGDAQNDILSSWARTVRAAYTRAPQARFMVHAGDLVNRAHSDEEWGEWFRAGGFELAMVPSLPAPGNHEYAGYRTRYGREVPEPLSVFWRPQFTLPENGPSGVTPESSYFVDYQDLRLVVLNSSEDLKAQARWLDEILVQNVARWTVVVHHHPVFSSAGRRDNPELRKAWQPIYDRYQVDLVLQGHDHTYARGRTPRVAPKAGEDGDGETGTVYVNSVSGPKMYPFKAGEWDGYDARLDRWAEGIQLFQVVEVEGDVLRFRAYAVTGALVDAFDLVKGDGAPNRLIDRSSETF